MGGGAFHHVQLLAQRLSYQEWRLPVFATTFHVNEELRWLTGAVFLFLPIVRTDCCLRSLLVCWCELIFVVQGYYKGSPKNNAKKP